MHKLGSTFFLFVGTLLAAIGCSSKPAPEPIHIGEDVCAKCRMAIIDPQFASEIVMPSGEVLKFDDLGCCASAARDREIPSLQHVFVQDYATREWISGENTLVVASSQMRTPMGSGAVAFASREVAERFMTEHGGQLISLQEFMQR